MTPKKTIPVVGGIFHRWNSQSRVPEVLLFERKKEDVGGGLFEFPGGKVEEGESEKQALLREMQEELGISVQIGDCLGSAEFTGRSGQSFILTLYFVSGDVQNIQLLDHDSAKWESRKTLVEGELALGDRPLIRPVWEFLESFYRNQS